MNKFKFNSFLFVKGLIAQKSLKDSGVVSILLKHQCFQTLICDVLFAYGFANTCLPTYGAPDEPDLPFTN